MRSKSQLTSRAVRCGVPLKTMCSRKWVTPQISGVSSREPVRTKKPKATERAEGLVSAMTCRPFGNDVCSNATRILLTFSLLCVFASLRGFLCQRIPRKDAKTRRKTEGLGFQREGLGSQRHDGVVARRMASHVIDDSLRRQAVDGRLDLVEAANAAQVVPIGRQSAGAG